METETLVELVVDALDDLRAADVVTIDVHGKTSITDMLVIASGTSERHVRSLADRAADRAKEAGIRPLGIEGTEGGDWVLVDLAEVIVHVMSREKRDFYNLEKLWSMESSDGSAAGGQ